MRLLIVVYDQGVDETVMTQIEEMGLPGWTKVFNAHGEGGRGRKLNDPIWPGQNNLLYLQVSEEQAETVVGALKGIQNSHRLKPGITIWSMPVDVL
jgi:hypothetical protein